MSSKVSSAEDDERGKFVTSALSPNVLDQYMNKPANWYWKGANEKTVKTNKYI